MGKIPRPGGETSPPDVDLAPRDSNGGSVLQVLDTPHIRGKIERDQQIHRHPAADEQKGHR